MNLLPTDEQTQLIDAAKSFLAGEAPLERLRPQHGQIGNHDARLWPMLGELGFLGVGLSEDHGGLGLGAAEESLLAREYGRNLVSPGILGLILAAHLAAGDGALTEQILGGKVKVGLGFPRTAGGLHLLEARGADYVVLYGEQGSGLYSPADLDEVSDILCMDSHLSLQRAKLGDARAVRSSGGPGLYQLAIMLFSAYAVGVAQGALEMGVEYAKVREQFGKPIGSFQAVKHKCADMAIAAQVASCQVAFASVALAARREDAGFQVRAANLVAIDAALKNGATNIQVHGAIGFTADIAAHLFLKRAHVLDTLSGSLREQRGAMLNDPVPA
jgi:alkylation response protein AidB-like acyl-CoA dehydrogenase